jgi:glycosyltransferase involved in cell wall biosynthesis
MTTSINLPCITLVTVTLNSSKYLEDCIRSVISQNYPALEYIVVDGGSTDATLSILEKYKSHISVLISEPDKGPAHALNKGFHLSSGQIMGWLNSDDKLHPGSLFAVAEIFQTFSTVSWIMGYPTWFNTDGSCVNEMSYVKDIFYKSPSFINDSMHLKFARWSKWRFAMGDFSAIQQESVFWRRSLWEKAGAMLQEDRISYDLELWTRFFQETPLYTTNAVLGGFRIHGNQISVIQKDRYNKESRVYIDNLKRWLVRKNRSGYLRLLLAKLLKVFYYYEIPLLKSLYIRALQLPPFIIFDSTDGKFKLTG